MRLDCCWTSEVDAMNDIPNDQDFPTGARPVVVQRSNHSLNRLQSNRSRGQTVMPRMLELASGRWARIAFVLVLIISVFIVPAVVPVSATGTNCITSTSPSGTYTVTPCITAPADLASITGDQTISATYTTTGANPGVAKLIFYLGGNYLITDYGTPYTFTLPSTKFVDGSYSLAVAALMKDGFTSQLSSITVTLNNGITTPPVNNNTFTPTSGTTPPSGQPFVLAAAGDGADGANNAGA